MIVASISDLILRSKVSEAAKQLGQELTIAKGKDDLLSSVGGGSVTKLLVDLNTLKFDVFEVLKEVHQLSPHTSVVGFFSHVNTEIGDKARALGFVEVMPRSKFFSNLEQLFG